MSFEIIDRQTGLRVGQPHTNKQRARNKRDALDTAHGAARYSVRPVAA